MTVLALSPFAATFGLVVVFFVVFPLLVHGIGVFIGAQVYGEHASNQKLIEDGADIGEGLTPRTGGAAH